VSLRAAIPDDSDDAGLVHWRQHLETGAVYGELLSRIIEAGWRTLSIGYLAKQSRSPHNKSALAGAISEYDGAWAAYNGFRISNPFGATLYKDTYSHGSPGMGASVDALRNSSLKTDDVIGSAGAEAGVRAGTAPDLHRVANKILDRKTGQPVLLKGVAMMGGEYSCVSNAGIFAGPADTSVVKGMASWGINAIRLPMNEDCKPHIAGIYGRLHSSKSASNINIIADRLAGHPRRQPKVLGQGLPGPLRGVHGAPSRPRLRRGARPSLDQFDGASAP